jgi:rubredoxin
MVIRKGSISWTCSLCGFLNNEETHLNVKEKCFVCGEDFSPEKGTRIIIETVEHFPLD